jgi:hypothetical protein
MKAFAKKYPKDGTDEEKKEWAHAVLGHDISDIIVAAVDVLNWKIVYAYPTVPVCKWPFDSENEYGFKCPDWCEDPALVVLDKDVFKLLASIRRSKRKASPSLQVIEGWQHAG